eukprot:1348131-Alexandrium_andersonii.AAC.1
MDRAIPKKGLADQTWRAESGMCSMASAVSTRLLGRPGQFQPRAMEPLRGLPGRTPARRRGRRRYRHATSAAARGPARRARSTSKR